MPALGSLSAPLWQKAAVSASSTLDPNRRLKTLIDRFVRRRADAPVPVPVPVPVIGVGQTVAAPAVARAETAPGAGLEVVGLTDRSEHFPRQLSGGQQQRVGIARAVVSDPTIILGDEPTGDLDAASGKEILDLLERLSSDFGKTILMVTHDAHAASRAQAIMHMDKGVLSR